MKINRDFWLGICSVLVAWGMVISAVALYTWASNFTVTRKDDVVLFPAYHELTERREFSVKCPDMDKPVGRVEIRQYDSKTGVTIGTTSIPCARDTPNSFFMDLHVVYP